MMVGRDGKLWWAAPQPCFFREADQAQSAVKERADTPHPHESHGVLYCRQCQAPVTSEQERLRVLGKHCHAFPNPEGLVFEIGCFSMAPGCVLQGASTTQFSWFPPHAWSLALCGTCKTHLGWYYEAVGKSSFYGLILDRLVEE